MSARGFLKTLRPYTPPADLDEVVRSSLMEAAAKAKNSSSTDLVLHDDWRSTSLEVRRRVESGIQRPRD